MPIYQNISFAEEDKTDMNKINEVLEQSGLSEKSIYEKGIHTNLLKIFDKEGNTLVLRPDITPSIARAAATLFPDNDMPIRLCYTGNTFVNYPQSYQGRLREIHRWVRN